VTTERFPEHHRTGRSVAVPLPKHGQCPGKVLTRFTLLPNLNLDEVLAPALGTLEDEPIAAGLRRLDKREPHSGFAMRTHSI
jgi:hypothetical protein